jgi:mono/diheme cytochrome c family protein
VNPQIDISSWLQVFGRLHPLVLHLPIGLLIGLALLEVVALVARRDVASSTRATLIWLAALAAALTASMGWLLGKEGGYDPETLNVHRRFGIGVAIASLVLALVQTMRHRALATRLVLLVCVALLLPAGHYGSALTRGAGFLSEPLHAQVVASEVDTSTYARLIAPIFQHRCASCHGPTKRKANLALHDGPSLLAGGVHGPVIVAGEPDQSELLRRLRLPPTDKDHMPPKDKPQPTAAEIDLLVAWVAAGAPLTGNVLGLGPLPP